MTLAPLADRRNGASWSIQPITSATNQANGLLDAVSCPSTRACVAVGTYTPFVGNAKTLAERWRAG